MGMRMWGECESEGGGDDGDENEVEVGDSWWWKMSFEVPVHQDQ
jgi:hypothetical protein